MALPSEPRRSTLSTSRNILPSTTTSIRSSFPSSPTTRNTYTPSSPLGTTTTRNIPRTVSYTYRDGDWIVTRYTDGATSKTYSPLNTTGGFVARPTTGSKGGGTLSPSGNTVGGGAYGHAIGGSMATPTSGNNSTGGGGSSGGGGGLYNNPGSVTGGLNDSDVGKLFGWTKDMTETDVIRGLEYPMRILQQITGGPNGTAANNPAFAAFMSPIVENASNPNTQLLFNPQLGGSNTTTGSEGYNFIADLMKGYMTPGGALPDVGSALARIASALGNNQSGIYNLLMQGASGTGASQGNSGMGAYGAMMDALSSMIQPILNLGASPLQSMITNASMNNLMHNFNMNVNDQSENPLAYMLRGLGYNTNIAGMPQVGGAGGINAGQNTPGAQLNPGNAW